MMLTDLADACRKSGLKVVEIDGWRTRGHGPMTTVATVACHHTATSRAAAGDYPSLGIVRDGRSDLPGPLAQLGLGRSGTVYVIAAGVCWHAGETWTADQGNWRAIGIEAEHDGISPWPEVLVDAYARLCRALVDHYELGVDRVQGHKEICKPTGRKSDPNFDMPAFRERVATTSNQEDPFMALTEKQQTQLVADVAETKKVVEQLAVDEQRRNETSRERDKRIADRIAKKVGKSRDQILAEFDDEA